MPRIKPEAIQCPVCSASHVPSGLGTGRDGVYAATCVQCGHFFKFRSVQPFKSTVTLAVNGQEYTVGNEYGPSTALNTFLRDKRISTGTKHMCFQGGCGACLVEVKLFEPITEEKLSYAVNSCITPLFACDGWEITTVEYIGNQEKGLHPIQRQIADYNGSQCGYCTPGQVMNMYALSKYYGSSLTKKDVEDSFDGVICRCTGYRPILQAFKDMVPAKCSFKTDDIEDIRGKLCKKTGEACSGQCSTSKMLHIVTADTQWFRPTSQKELTDTINNNKGKNIRFLFGNTSTGVYSDQGPDNFDAVIDIANVRELYGISFDTDILFGSALSLSNLVDIFNRVSQESDLVYLKECANLLSRVANLPVRNRSTWAGNIVMKYKHKEFPSDVMILLYVLKAKIWFGFDAESVDINQFLTYDIKDKVIICFSFTTLDTDDVIKFYKVTQRAQNAHCYVTGGFRAKIDKNSNFLVKEQPVLAFAGIAANFNRATQTETYLNGKQLGDPNVIKTALTTLKTEIVPDESPVLSSPAYRSKTALGLFYKFILHVLGDKAGSRFRTAPTQMYLERPISSGQQSYDTNKMEWPVTEPMKKLEANAQACGEAVYIDDIPEFPGQLEAAFVLSTVGNAKLASIDASEALKMPGVVKVITAKDIPGQNNFSMAPILPEEVLASDTISYCGQPVAIVIAESYGTALGAVYAVKVTYTDIQPPVLTIHDAIQKQSFFPKPCDDLVVGNPEEVIKNSPKKITGTISMGTQYHFHMETQTSLCVPTEDSMNVFTSTQWIHYCQNSISQVTGRPVSSINVEVKRLGGAYGGKITRNCWMAAACGLCAHLTNKPVKFRLTLEDNMKIMGKRFPFVAMYEVGFTEVGQLNAIKMTYYGDCGMNPNDNSLPPMQVWADNAYYCPNWLISCEAVKTNTATNTACRSPGSLPAIFIMESLMEQVAKSIDKDATDIRLMNMYTQGQVNPLTNMTLNECLLKPSISNLMTQTDYNNRVQQAIQFNQANRWKKKGLSMVPLKFGISWQGVHYTCQVTIYYSDGTIAISHAGIEMGQGINTKVAQVCAYELGIPMDTVRAKATNSIISGNSINSGGSITSMNCCEVAQVCAYELGIPMDTVRVKATNSMTSSNSITSGGSITSMNCCEGVLQCCSILKARMAPVKAKMKDPTWVQLVAKCYEEGIDLTARFWINPDQKDIFQYYTYGATIAEVELDVLTGEYQISRVDVEYDCGQSTNPALDIGQAEGAFVMGLGYWLTEECKYDPTTGELVTNDTWEYKPPSSKDIPVEFNVSFLKKASTPKGVLGAKAVGEPPMCMSCAALFALKRAIEEARKETGVDNFFPLNAPATVEAAQLACLTDISQFVIA